MRHGLLLTPSIVIGAIVVLLLPHSTAAQSRATEATMTASNIHIPKSVQAEHEAIHSALVEATHAPGRVGTAAKDLADVLHPHFVREEQIALPPLGLLAPLAAGDPLPESVASEALAMTDALRSELPRMLEEHTKIRAAVEKLRLAARAEQATQYEQLADQLALHAQTEEEVLYPAAVLVGDVIRARRQSPSRPSEHGR
jgi:hemerythrin HHE cation binding domain-containing protein